jgi:hypothetical protein
MVLQHLPTNLAKSYLAEFLRVLTPGGILVVQIPARRVAKRFRYALTNIFPWIGSSLRRLRGAPPRIPMRVIPRSQVEGIVAQGGGEVLEAAPDGASGPEFESIVYYVRKASQFGGTPRASV